MNAQNIDVQGHRGCRGLYPENTIPAFIHAIDLGVNTLECDVVISKDLKVIVSHEPFFNHEITTLPNGAFFTKKDEEEHNVFELDYAEIKLYDTGSKYFSKFPFQNKIKTYKPSLEDVVNEVNKRTTSINYNIEIKRRVEWDGIFHPDFKKFADLVVAEINVLGIMERTTVQCFDIQTLKYIHESYPKVRLVYLAANENSVEKNIELLGFMPFVYSPYFKMINNETVSYCKKNNLQLIPWTVNEEEDIKKQIEIGVDGIISDYPDRIIDLLKE